MIHRKFDPVVLLTSFITTSQQIFQSSLFRVLDFLYKAQISPDEDSPDVGHPCQWLNQVPVGCPGEVEHDLDGLVVGGLELLHLPAAKLPQLRPSEMRVIDAVNSELTVGGQNEVLD